MDSLPLLLEEVLSYELIHFGVDTRDKKTRILFLTIIIKYITLDLLLYVSFDFDILISKSFLFCHYSYELSSSIKFYCFMLKQISKYTLQNKYQTYLQMVFDFLCREHELKTHYTKSFFYHPFEA